MFRLITILFLAAISTACAVNPVTGEQQLMFLSEGEDAKIGQSQYKPAQQSQGGLYYLDPELTLYVAGVGKKLAAVSDRPDLPYEFVILNNSVPNAWALPSGKIAINRGLLTKLQDEAQLAAVLSHEIVHAAARHSAQRMQQGMIVEYGMMGLGLATDGTDYKDLIIGGAAMGAQLTMAQYGQDHELESDKYGMKYMAKAGYDLNAAVELQQLFVKLSNNQQSNWLQGLFASHPPSPERVEANRKHVAEFPSSGNYRGKADFDQRMKYLLSKSSAYSAQDKAVALINQKKFSAAMSEIDKAIKAEPNEALFYATKGDIYSAQGIDTLAVKQYEKSVALFPEQFSSYLKKGVSNEKLGNLEQAKKDFARSAQLLPTSVAELGLGNIAQIQGDQRSAIRHFEKASQAGGNNGKSARIKLAKLELPNKPEKYIKIKHTLGKNRELQAYAENHSEITVIGIELESTITDAAGKVVNKQRWKIQQAIQAQSRSRVEKDPVIDLLPEGYRVNSRILSADIAK
ncbi:M48 family metalloprotease [Alkalimarinus sediminis]|uniref:M48 family metalloprotease n=1 Tax=Alkalimarinus sediminis TaxID=1632866 RepID=A0A9E8HL56_9ALTE|nr:M48 family metalloprotease [Alkalimarinus sediminis]UZW76635.1 M48 family metalloprotease [Alkalimarinus sediminis]